MYSLDCSYYKREFENIDEDKYVDLEKSVNMECIYSNKFRKWIPQKIVSTQRIANLRQLGELIRNNK